MCKERPPQLTKEDLEELLHREVHSFTSTALTAPGENYGSTMLLVNATLLPDHEDISIAAKLVPATSFMREIFHFRDTVRKEIDMYVQARPEFYSIQEEYGVPEELFLDVIPRCYGARTTRGGGLDLPVDESSAILMENLKVSGYKLVDRMTGMDLKHTEYVVARLARFHATAIVIKLKKPRVFKDTVLRAAVDFKRTPPSSDDPFMNVTTILNSLSCVPSIVQYREKVKAVLEAGIERLTKDEVKEIREPFATLIHNDFWTNNMMFSYNGIHGENISGFKIVDFQMTGYGSPAVDLLFFLCSSTSLNITKEDIDRLIHIYHQEFTKWLQFFGCDTEPFSYENFMKEVEAVAPQEFGHALFILKIICMPESNVQELTKSGMDKLLTDDSALGDIYYKKIDKLVKVFVERNWI